MFRLSIKAGVSTNKHEVLTLELRKGKPLTSTNDFRTYNLSSEAARVLLNKAGEVVRDKIFFEIEEADIITEQQEAMLTFQQLTRREREIMQWIVKGLTNRQIAKKLQVSFKTVDNHRTRLMKKLGVHNAVELVHWVMNYRNKTVYK